jgi:hypothetical protein
MVRLLLPTFRLWPRYRRGKILFNIEDFVENA